MSDAGSNLALKRAALVSAAPRESAHFDDFPRVPDHRRHQLRRRGALPCATAWSASGIGSTTRSSSRLLSISQSLPGLNATNMAVLLGDRLKGVDGRGGWRRRDVPARAASC